RDRHRNGDDDLADRRVIHRVVAGGVNGGRSLAVVLGREDHGPGGQVPTPEGDLPFHNRPGFVTRSAPRRPDNPTDQQQETDSSGPGGKTHRRTPRFGAEEGRKRRAENAPGSPHVRGPSVWTGLPVVTRYVSVARRAERPPGVGVDPGGEEFHAAVHH